MAELAGPLRVMKIAIQTAMIAYPDYERESGTKWPDKHLDPAEAQLFAFAALRALDGAGFDIVPKKDEPPRVCRRLRTLRRWSDGEQDDKPIFTGSADTRRSAGFRAREGSSLAVGDGDFDCREDRLHGAVAQ